MSEPFEANSRAERLQVMTRYQNRHVERIARESDGAQVNVDVFPSGTIRIEVEGSERVVVVKRNKHLAPRLFRAANLAVAGLLAVLVLDGTLPLTTSGPRGAEHVIFGAALLGAWWGFCTGWPTTHAGRQTLLDMTVAAAAAIGMKELRDIHAGGKR